jgi:hypothetical protein
MTALNLSEVREWLEIVYGDTPGLINICSTADWAGKIYSNDQIDFALHYIQSLDRRGVEGIYARATTLRQAPPTGQRGGDDLSFYLPGLWADIDIAGPGHKTKNILPPDVDAAIAIVNMSGLPEPSHWIHSGGGLYPWWLLTDAAQITDLEGFRNLSASWQQALAAGAAKLGYHYGSGVGDLSRVLRIPGTLNRKAGMEKPCTALTQDGNGNSGYAWSGPRYTLDELIAAAVAVAPEPEAPKPAVVKTGSGLQGEKPGEEFNRTASWHDILEPHGWSWVRKMGDSWYLRRPGKTHGTHSASLRTSTDCLYVFSEEAFPFEVNKPYSKFGALAVLEHGGDFSAAAKFLASRGYGATRTPMVAASPVPTASVAPRAAVMEAPTPEQPMDQGPPTQEVTRNMLVANDDRWLVWQNLTKELVSRWDKDRLFNYGNVICERDGLTMRPATKDVLDGITAETCQVVNLKTNAKGQESYVKALIESRILGMVMAFPKEFSKLDKLSQIPFLRPDGTICSTPGYDEPTHSFLELDPELQGIDIPEAPTREQVASARSFLLDDLLGDFPLHTEADKANALATLITPFVRDLIPTSPLAVIDAKEAGSGKNLLADVISILTTGKAAQTLPYTTEAEEQRKVITSAFRSGSAMLLFDEAHVIEGAAFARALTSHSYQDRVLGASDLAEFPNNRTWVSLGNQVQIKGDMGRRVYRVRLEYPGARPESREASDFKHPDLRQWTMDNRRELVRACLTLVRAWFALGKPVAPLPFRMGSFEKWQEILAGVLWVAGVEGFLVNVPQWRSESDFERQDQVAHLWWLETQFGAGEFTSAGVTDALRRDRQAPHPHNMDDPFQEGYARKLGQMYAKLKDRILDGYQLVKLDGKAHDKVIKWKIRKIEEEANDPSPE